MLMNTTKTMPAGMTRNRSREHREEQSVMSTYGRRWIGYGGVAALLAGLVLGMFSAVAQDTAAPPPPPAQEASDAGAAGAAPAESAVATAALPEDEQYYRRGVELYKQDLYREALTEFNRALAINPNHEEARRFQEKANARLQESLAGVSGAAPAFETIDPDTIRKQGETIPPNADEVKRERIRNLLDTAARYMEAERYKVAVEIYSNVLLIDPNNPEAKEGLHKATLGARAQNVAEEEKGIQQDRAMIREYIEKSKRLPEGADATGIKPYKFSVPEIEEKIEETKEKSTMETVLESPVSIEFEDIHLSEVVNFISDSWDINIVIDNRAVEPPAKAQPPQGGQPAGGAPGAPGMPGAFPGAPGAPGMPGAFPGAVGAPGAPGAFPAAGARPGAAPAFGAQRPGTPGYGPQQPGAQGTVGASYDAVYGPKSSGIIPYINMKNVSLGEALKAILRPLGLDYAIQPGFLWISKPEIIRRETFEKLETRYYELRNAGSETLYKLVLRNRFGGVGGRMGGMMGGGMMGGMGGYGGGMMGGMGGYGGGMMGGMGGGLDVTAISNISDLFSTISDTLVGEMPATIGTLGLRATGTGAMGGATTGYGGGYGGGYGAAQNQAQLGAGQSNFGLGSDLLSMLERLVPPVYEPYTNEVLSDMIYNPMNNMLIVKNTPSNLDAFEKQLAQIDVTPKQVSIEAKFVTIRLNDLKKIGFKWDASLSDKNNRRRPIPILQQNGFYNYDINGDGVDERVPFYTRPDGSSVYNNTFTDATIGGLINPASTASPTFSILGNIINSGDGDKLSLTLDYLDSIGESELLSAPRVTTMNRKPAVIADFTTEYYVSAIYTDIYQNYYGGVSGGNTTNFINRVIPQSYNFGISLSVTPQIRDNDQVRLWLNPEVRTRIGQKTFQQTQVINGSELTNEFVLPTTSWQAVWTNVIVHDGDTLVLGGLVQDQTSKATDKMPYLADIPVIGFFFQGKSKETKQSSLLIFVTPQIVDSTGARFFNVGADTSRPGATQSPI